MGFEKDAVRLHDRKFPDPVFLFQTLRDKSQDTSAMAALIHWSIFYNISKSVDHLFKP